MDKDLVCFKEIIENNSFKFTKKRQYILETLIKSNIHLDAEKIYDMVKAKSVGIATVYRSLNLFKELNIIRELNVNGTNYYEMKIFSSEPLNIHFKCVQCNSIIDVENKNLHYFELDNEDNLVIFDTDIMLVGICKKCMEDKNGKTNQIQKSRVFSRE